MFHFSIDVFNNHSARLIPVVKRLLQFSVVTHICPSALTLLCPRKLGVCTFLWISSPPTLRVSLAASELGFWTLDSCFLRSFSPFLHKVPGYSSLLILTSFMMLLFKSLSGTGVPVTSNLASPGTPGVLSMARHCFSTVVLLACGLDDPGLWRAAPCTVGLCPLDAVTSLLLWPPCLGHSQTSPGGEGWSTPCEETFDSGLHLTFLYWLALCSAASSQTPK